MSEDKDPKATEDDKEEKEERELDTIAKKLRTGSKALRVTVNPEDAARIGLREGGRALLANETGRLELRVAISDVVAPGVALAHKGRWPKLDGGGANVNFLNPGCRTDMGESSGVHGTRVRITPL